MPRSFWHLLEPGRAASRLYRRSKSCLNIAHKLQHRLAGKNLAGTHACLGALEVACPLVHWTRQSLAHYTVEIDRTVLASGAVVVESTRTGAVIDKA